MTRVGLVTGGTRGIGLGIARALAREGWNLVLCGTRAEADVVGTLESLRQLGTRVTYDVVDVANREHRTRFAQAIASRYGALHAIVNNAGRAPRRRADILEADEDSFTELIETNLRGPYFLTQALAREQVRRRQTDPSFAAAIVFITSVSADLASINRGDYCISKAGLSMAARLFALRLAPDGIPVYEVRPGIIETDMTANVREVYDKRIADGLVPDGRWGTPDDVGRIVAALLRGDAPYATGSVITVDGGLSLPRL
jgi:3-oxoacyl-[acyl-carrier protein] reductase